MNANPLIKRKVPALSGGKFLRMLFLYVIYAWALINTYDFQLAEANAYTGMQPWEMTSASWVYLVIALPLIALMGLRLKGHPSDFFVFFYSAIPVISFLTLTSASGKINDAIMLPSLLIVAFPLYIILIIKYLMPQFKQVGFVRSIIIERVLLCLLFVVIIYTYINAPASASFDIHSSYERRFEGRDLYTNGSMIAYALVMCMNCFVPYLAFKDGVNGKRLLVLIAFGAAVFFYWLLGVKAPVVYVLISYFLGLSKKKGWLPYFVKYFLIGVIGLYFFILVEWWLFDDYSIIADYVFRRLFPVQAMVQGFYLDFLMGNTPANWNLFYGVLDQSFQATYYIGEKYMGNSIINVNTNAFLYAFLANGLLGYIFSGLFVSIILVAFDRLYRSTQNPSYLFLGFIYGLLVIEQAFSTAMISSGVGLLFLFTLLEKYNIPLAATHHTKKTKKTRAAQ